MNKVNTNMLYWYMNKSSVVTEFHEVYIPRISDLCVYLREFLWNLKTPARKSSYILRATTHSCFTSFGIAALQMFGSKEQTMVAHVFVIYQSCRIVPILCQIQEMPVR